MFTVNFLLKSVDVFKLSTCKETSLKVKSSNKFRISGKFLLYMDQSGQFGHCGSLGMVIHRGRTMEVKNVRRILRAVKSHFTKYDFTTHTQS